MITIKIAGLIIKVKNKYSFTEYLCKNYIVKSNSFDIEVEATRKQIEKEMKDSNYQYTEDYCESICIYRNLCEKLIPYNCFLFHSSVVEVDGESYAFTAQSGTGKTTHTNLWLKYFKDNARIINGDKPILKINNDKVVAYGTPWCGKEGFNINTSSNLKSICFLERGITNKIRKLNKSEVVDRIIHQLILPTNQNAVIKLLDMVDKLIEIIPCYLLSCNISEEAVLVAYKGMKEE